jgi:ubiquinone/menaquinone biosynthesis C-methylase UbiE
LTFSSEKELESLDIHHALMLALLDGRLHWAPIDPNPQRVLDIGTGTGIWAIDFGEVHQPNTGQDIQC